MRHATNAAARHFGLPAAYIEGPLMLTTCARASWCCALRNTGSTKLAGVNRL